MITSGLMSSLADDWGTPKELFDDLRGRVKFERPDIKSAFAPFPSAIVIFRG